MTDWKGAFLRKHIKTVTFVPLEEMEQEDWEILDYPILRPLAKKRLQVLALAGKFCGFHRVAIDMHKSHAHGGKPVYLWPGEPGDYDDSDFENFRDYDEEVEPEATFEEQYVELNAVAPKQLEDRLAKAGVNRRKAASWPKWAMVVALIALKYCKDMEEDDNGR